MEEESNPENMSEENKAVRELYRRWTEEYIKTEVDRRIQTEVDARAKTIADEEIHKITKESVFASNAKLADAWEETTKTVKETMEALKEMISIEKVVVAEVQSLNKTLKEALKSVKLSYVE